MTPEQIKSVKHYTNKLQILLAKYDCSKNINIRKDISDEIENILSSYRIDKAKDEEQRNACKNHIIIWEKQVSER